MPVWLYAIGSVMVVVLFTTIFCLIGKIILNKIGISNENMYQKIAASYFIGMAVYLAVLRTVSLFVHSYKISFWIVLFTFGIVAIIDLINCHLKVTGRNILFAVTLSGIWIIHIIVHHILI